MATEEDIGKSQKRNKERKNTELKQTAFFLSVTFQLMRRCYSLATLRIFASVVIINADISQMRIAKDEAIRENKRDQRAVAPMTKFNNKFVCFFVCLKSSKQIGYQARLKVSKVV